MSADPVGNIRRWLERLEREAAVRRTAEARAATGEWNIPGDAKPTSQAAKLAVASLLGDARVRWHREGGRS